MTDTSHALRVYCVDASGGAEARWFEIGAAFPQQDGKGFEILLRALPMSPRLVLRESAETRQRDAPVPYAQRVNAFERAMIEHYLMAAGGRITTVMAQLAIPRRTLTEKMARLGIDRRTFVAQNGKSRAKRLAPKR